MGLVTFSFFPALRRYWFTLWYASHIVLAIAVIVLKYLHAITLILVVAFWWLLDLPHGTICDHGGL
jgi:hypothetical protein